MKVFIAICAVLAMANADTWLPRSASQIVEGRKRCMESLRIPAADITLLEEFKYREMDSLHRCFVRCSVIENGIWTDDLGIDLDRFVEQVSTLGRTIDKMALKTFVGNCIEESKGLREDKCSWAFKTIECIYKFPGLGKPIDIIKH